MSFSISQLSSKEWGSPILGFLLITLSVAVAPAQAPTRAVRPANVTGHYRLRNPETPNSLDVLQLPGGKIKFHIVALWVSAHNPENVHNGELQGIVALNGDTAVYEGSNCKVMIKFVAGKAIVTQADAVGDCDFGANVTATGTYRKLNNRKPRFREP
ncbi:MAG: hypothetical protein QOD75_3758 [Blastocatellia bacterium]|jgi:hypothetical protein|nr:hypothetical protein [Blastocatellia bacterium]